ncbi:hypothetical protein J8L73_11100 [Pseudoalteromonas sp. MMG006]|uniref:hypothetical protein n=1 Tax=Pseudoalteromonas sp. MMG006 TaxID=2822683 RepID=UPI001B39954B|nr:hypothetical protein [Pseudoalteromonas sp. MMG006]MBQ4799668.1 hypothetical protein [Pseudoalteromonas sp. MMG006]
MQYVITIFKNNEFHIGSFDNAEEAFESAVLCAAEAVSSILENDEIKVECNPPRIIISSETDALPFTIEECKKKIKIAFTDNDGRTYPEFSRVEVNPI